MKQVFKLIVNFMLVSKCIANELNTVFYLNLITPKLWQIWVWSGFLRGKCILCFSVLFMVHTSYLCTISFFGSFMKTKTSLCYTPGVVVPVWSMHQCSVPSHSCASMLAGFQCHHFLCNCISYTVTHCLRYTNETWYVSPHPYLTWTIFHAPVITLTKC